MVTAQPVLRPTRARRRVLLLNISLANGGLERQLCLLARRLPDEWERRVWTLEGGPFAEVLRGAGVAVDVVPRRFRFDPLPALRLWSLVRQWRPDVVHAWHWMPALAAIPACASFRMPLIDGSIRMGMIAPEAGRPRRLPMRFAARVVANSRAGLEAWGIPPAKGRVVYNAFDPERYYVIEQARAADPQSSACSGDRITVVMAARMRREKDFATVIAAARLLEAEQPDRWRFLLIGDGPERRGLEQQGLDLVARGSLVFVDAGLEPLPWVAGADIGVLMTVPRIHAEGCSNAIMEYMACGLPVVCSRGGGNAELVQDGISGYIIPSQDASALAARLRELAGDARRRERLGAAGLARLKDGFSVEAMVNGFLGVYEEALAEQARR